MAGALTRGNNRRVVSVFFSGFRLLLSVSPCTTFPQSSNAPPPTARPHSRQEQELTKNRPAEDRAKQDEIKELADREEDLVAEVEAQRQERLAKEAARDSSTQVGAPKAASSLIVVG